MEGKVLQTLKKGDKLAIKDGLIVCPVCRQKTNQTIFPETTADFFPLWCRRCKSVHLVKIASGQCYMISRCR